MARNARESKLDPIAAAYLADLEVSLRNSPNRDEVLRSVTEHLAEATAGWPEHERATATRQALTELGTVEQLASVAGVESNEAPEARTSDKVLATLAALSVPAAFLPIIGLALALGALVASIALLLAGRRTALVKVAIGCALAGLAIALVVVALVLPAGVSPGEEELPVTPVRVGQ